MLAERMAFGMLGDVCITSGLHVIRSEFYIAGISQCAHELSDISRTGGRIVGSESAADS